MNLRRKHQHYMKLREGFFANNKEIILYKIEKMDEC